MTLSLIPRVVTGGTPGPRTYTVPAGATLELPDVLAKEFGLGDPSAAGIRVHAAPDARLVVGSRTYVEREAGTLGFSIAGQAVDEAIGAGDGASASIQLGQARDRRTNFGFAEVAGEDATVRVEAHGPGGDLLGARTYAVHGGESFQAPASDLLGKDVAGAGPLSPLRGHVRRRAHPRVRSRRGQRVGRRDLRAGGARVRSVFRSLE